VETSSRRWSFFILKLRLKILNGSHFNYDIRNQERFLRFVQNDFFCKKRKIKICFDSFLISFYVYYSAVEVYDLINKNFQESFYKINFQNLALYEFAQQYNKEIPTEIYYFTRKYYFFEKKNEHNWSRSTLIKCISLCWNYV